MYNQFLVAEFSVTVRSGRFQDKKVTLANKLFYAVYDIDPYTAFHISKFKKIVYMRGRVFHPFRCHDVKKIIF